MKDLIFIVFLILTINLVSSLSVDFSCPNEINENDEFSCSISISDSESRYDVKLDFLCNGKRVSRIWSQDQWKSTNYYLIDFIGVGEDKQVKLKVENFTENCDGLLKLRKTGKTSIDYQQNVSIGLNPSAIIEENKDIGKVNSSIKDKKELDKPRIVENLSENNSITNVTSQNTEKVIKLNSDQEVKEIVYKSKDEIIRENLLIGFSVFLLIVIIILIIKK